MDALNYRILNTDGKEVGTMELAYSIFCAPVDEHLVHNVVVWQLAKARSGNHSTISKGEMRGGGKKPWRQKGTGRARVGSNNSPLWRHGAVTFGPKPRDYTKRITKAEKRKALAAALSSKVLDSSLVILDDLKVSERKTKAVKTILNKINASDGSALIVLPVKDSDVLTSARNLKGVTAMSLEGINVYDLVRHKYFVSTESAINALQKKIKENKE